MKEIINRGSPDLLIGTGADNHLQTRRTNRQKDEYHHLPDETDPRSIILHPEKRRLSPAVWEACIELKRHGMLVLPVKSGSQVMLDLIAWDRQVIYGIAVRRIRKDTGIKDIMVKYDTLIRGLQTLSLPANVEILLWIFIRNTFRVYNVLIGGLMNRNLP